jgi:hypothetical protein
MFSVYQHPFERATDTCEGTHEGTGKKNGTEIIGKGEVPPEGVRPVRNRWEYGQRA